MSLSSTKVTVSVPATILASGEEQISRNKINEVEDCHVTLTVVKAELAAVKAELAEMKMRAQVNEMFNHFFYEDYMKPTHSSEDLKCITDEIRKRLNKIIDYNALFDEIATTHEERMVIARFLSGGDRIWSDEGILQFFELCQKEDDQVCFEACMKTMAGDIWRERHYIITGCELTKHTDYSTKLCDHVKQQEKVE